MNSKKRQIKHKQIIKAILGFRKGQRICTFLYSKNQDQYEITLQFQKAKLLLEK